GARAEDYLKSVYLKSPAGRSRPDLVVLDPPRAGIGEAVTNSLLELGAPQVRYVSCDPATLARDIAPFMAAGYRIEEAHLFDLFPETFHIESVLLLARCPLSLRTSSSWKTGGLAEGPGAGNTRARAPLVPCIFPTVCSELG